MVAASPQTLTSTTTTTRAVVSSGIGELRGKTWAVPSPVANKLERERRRAMLESKTDDPPPALSAAELRETTWAVPSQAAPGVTRSADTAAASAEWYQQTAAAGVHDSEGGDADAEETEAALRGLARAAEGDAANADWYQQTEGFEARDEASETKERGANEKVTSTAEDDKSYAEEFRISQYKYTMDPRAKGKGSTHPTHLGGVLRR